jgi:hypothetical protein
VRTAVLLVPLIGLAAARPSRAPDVAPAIVEIVGNDYSFRVAPRLNAGRTTFRFRNDGKQRHEFNIFLLKRGVTIDQVVNARKQGKSQLTLLDGSVGVLFAEPGSRAPSSLTTNLLPGRDYGVICIFSDSAGKPRHYEMGMYSVVHVSGKSSAASPPPLDSVIAVDYAYPHYPREISPGRHTLVFRNAGKHRHEINVALLKKGITLDSIVAVDKHDGDVEPLFEQNGGHGVLSSIAGEAALGGLVIDFLPGREYLMDCGFQDDDKSPPHYKLGMYGSIKVRNSQRSH